MGMGSVSAWRCAEQWTIQAWCAVLDCFHSEEYFWALEKEQMGWYKKPDNSQKFKAPAKHGVL